MASIGIIANPASGKDIRRLVSYATTIDNQEKVNIVKRIVWQPKRWELIRFGLCQIRFKSVGRSSQTFPLMEG